MVNESYANCGIAFVANMLSVRQIGLASKNVT